MTHPFDGHVIESPGVTRTLAWPADDEIEGAQAVALAADVIAAFAPLLRPLSIDVLLQAFRRDTREPVALAHPHWFAVTSAAHAALQLAPSTQHAVQRTVDAIVPDAVTSLMLDALLAEDLGPDVAGRWDEVRMYANEVRLPDALADRPFVGLQVPGGDIGVPIDRRADGSWVGVRSAFEPSPIELLMTGQFVRLHITTTWSLWSPGGIGEPDLLAVIDALVARGWIHAP
jgi:hypothetical protein